MAAPCHNTITQSPKVKVKDLTPFFPICSYWLMRSSESTIFPNSLAAGCSRLDTPSFKCRINLEQPGLHSEPPGKTNALIFVSFGLTTELSGNPAKRDAGRSERPCVRASAPENPIVKDKDLTPNLPGLQSEPAPENQIVKDKDLTPNLLTCWRTSHYHPHPLHVSSSLSRPRTSRGQIFNPP